MKKLISSFLALAVIVSVLVPMAGVLSSLFSSAETVTVANINFSESFYSGNSMVQSFTEEHGKAIKFTRVSHISADWGRAVLFPLGNASEYLKLPAGAAVDVELDLFKEMMHPATDNGTDYRDFSVGIVYLTDTEVNNAREALNGGLATYASRVMKVADVDGALSGHWEKISGQITVSDYEADTKPYIVLYGNYQTSLDKTKIWVDNLKFNSASVSYKVNIDFSEEFYNLEHNIVNFDGSYGKSLCFNRVSISTTDEWGNALLHALGDDSGKLVLPSGEKLKVKFDIYKELLHPATAGGTDYRDFNVGIVYLTDAEKDLALASGGLKAYAGRIVKLGKIKGTLSSKWDTVSGEITVPEYVSDASAYMVLYGDYQTSFDKTKIWFDDIVITKEATSEPSSEEETVAVDIDFSESYYSGNNCVVHYNSAHGKSLYFNRISVSTENWGRAVMHAVGDDTGSLSLPAGSKFKVSLDVYKELLPPATAGGTDYRDFSIGIIYLTDTEVNNAREALSGGLMSYANRIMTLADVDGALSSDWEKVEGSFSVPKHSVDMTPYLVLYGNYQTSFDKTKVWLDNIVITADTESQPEEESAADIDFSEGYYSGNSCVVNYNSAHGKSLYFNRISISTENWGRAVMHAVGDDTGSLSLPAGSKFKVSLDVYKELLPPATAGGTDYRDFSVGLVYLNDTEVNNAREALSGGLMTYANRIMTLADVGGALSSDWEKVEGTFSVPKHSDDMTPYLVLYGNYQTSFDKTKVWIDNIVITKDTQSGESSETDKKIIADIDYSESFYDNSRKVIRYNGTHGRAQSFDRVSHISADWGRAVLWPMGDDEGKLDLMIGDVLTVSLEVIKNKLHPETTGGTDYRDFSIGMIYLTDAECYEVEQAENGGLSFYADRIMKLADVKGTLSGKDEWETVGGEITVLPHAPDTSPYMVLYGEYQTAFEFTEIWVDNVKFIREKDLGETYEISFETNGAGELGNVVYLDGFAPNLPMISRAGYYFEGWFTDPECKNPYTNLPSPACNFKLYAAWSKLEDIKVEALKTGFEPSDYDSGIVPYTNKAANDKIIIDAVTDQTNTETVKVLTNDAIAKEGTHTLYFDNFDYENFCCLYNRNSQGSNAAAMFNRDGTNFKIIAGVRYRISFDQFVNGAQMWDNKSATINFVVSKQMPVNGLLTTGAVSVYEFKFGEKCTDGSVPSGVWNHYEACFEAKVTGNLYMLMYSSAGKSGKDYYCRIDNLEIIPSSMEPITRMTFHKAVGDETVLDTFAGVPYGNIYGKPGSVFNEPSAPKITGKRFVKWVDSDNNDFTDYRFPNNDIDLYPVYENASALPMNTTMDWSKPITIGFENTDAVKQFYGDQRNMIEQKRYGVKPAYNDSKNAHSGSNYFSFYKAKNYNGSGVPFRLYCDGTPGNYVWLDANSRYRLTYYVNYKWQEDPVSELRTVGFTNYDSTDMEAFDKVEFRCAAETDERGWRKIEQIITIGPENRILGFQFWGGILTMDLDDISIEKLGIVTVSFDSNGGSGVAPIETGAYNTIIEPEYPTKTGYEFMGWYTDKKLTQKFDFTTTTIIKDITLYAKWLNPDEQEKEETEAAAKRYETVYETQYEERTVEEAVDSELDKNIVISSADKPADSKKNIKQVESNSDFFDWKIIVIIVAAVCVVAVAVFVIAVIAKKKKNKV